MLKLESFGCDLCLRLPRWLTDNRVFVVLKAQKITTRVFGATGEASIYGRWGLGPAVAAVTRFDSVMEKPCSNQGSAFPTLQAGTNGSWLSALVSPAPSIGGGRAFL